IVVVALVRPHVVPPAHIGGLPVLERALQASVASEVDVVGNPIGVVDVAGRHTRSRLNFGCAPLPYTFNAPCSPTAFGRMKIQFCHADSRPKMRVSCVSGSGNRRFASMPVSASGDSAMRDSIAWRIS